MQFKSTGALHVKDIDTKQGIVQTYWSKFGNRDDGGDIVMPGCWTKSINERGPQSRQPRIKFLYQHDEKMLLGIPSELVQDGFGLLATTKIVQTALGQDVLLLYEEGVISEHSIGYETVQAQWDSKANARLLNECVLWEGSCVTWGMNSETPVVAVKALTQPAQLTAWAERAQRIDHLLHHGDLHSEVLCERLDRELKSLHAALAPTPQTSNRSYTIQEMFESMGELVNRLNHKAASADDKAAQEARAKKYGIGVKDGGHVTKPGEWKDLDDADFGDPTNYRYPMPDKAHADNAASRFGAETAREQYTSDEQDKIAERIMKKQKSFGEEPDWWPPESGKGTSTHMLIKGSGGDIEVSEDGSHAAYTGTHIHSHKAMGAQGDDDMHKHKHSHDGDSKHDHPDAHKSAHTQRRRKTFAEHLTADMCQDLMTDWHDVIIHSFTCAVVDAFSIGDEPESDVSDALDGLKEAVMKWVAQAVECGLSDYLDEQGGNWSPASYPMQYGDDSQPDYYSPFIYGWMSRQSPQEAKGPQHMPAAPTLLGKAGRAVSSANRKVITDALDGMSEAMKAMKSHHGAIADLMTKTDPDAVRQDEDDTQGDDDTENGGHDVNKSRRQQQYTYPAPDRREQAGTTHQQGTSTLDLSALNADFDALTSRLNRGRKAK